MKVLLAVEPSRVYDGAIRTFDRLYLPPGSELFILYVSPVPQNVPRLVKERILNISKPAKPVEKEAREQVRQFLEKVEKRVKRFSLELHVHLSIKKGNPGEEILKFIHAKKVDLVILGAHEYSRMTRFLLGSVSHWVLHEAPCSVVIGRNPPAGNKKSGGMNLLLATDGSSDSAAAVDFLNTIQFPSNSHLTILHVIKKSFNLTEPMLATYRTQRADFYKLAEDLRNLQKREGMKLLQETRAALVSSALKIKERLALGNEAQEILKSAHQLRTDLIVVGSKGSTGLRRFFLGSVSDKVVHGAPCSVAVIRRQSKA
jgi:nucleotide-binding universal stress UspA family protein